MASSPSKHCWQLHWELQQLFSYARYCPETKINQRPGPESSWKTRSNRSTISTRKSWAVLLCASDRSLLQEATPVLTEERTGKQGRLFRSEPVCRLQVSAPQQTCQCGSSKWIWEQTVALFACSKVTWANKIPKCNWIMHDLSLVYADCEL